MTREAMLLGQIEIDSESANAVRKETERIQENRADRPAYLVHVTSAGLKGGACWVVVLKL